MNEQLIKFIEFCLADGVISVKEEEVIFRKSKELGVPDDECEIILEGMISQYNKKDNKEVKDNINKDIDIKESYINLETPQDWMTNLNTINEKIVDYLNSENEKIKTFISSGDFKNFIQKSPFVFEKNILDIMINQPRTIGFFSVKSSTLEWEVENQIKNILDVEEFFGYTPYHIYLLDQEELNKDIEHQSKYCLGDKGYWDNWCFSIFTNKGIHTFQRLDETHKKYDKNRTGFISYESLKEKYDNDTYNNNPDHSPFDPPFFYTRFLFLYSHDFKFKPLILNLKLTFDDEEFLEKVSSLNLNDEDLSNLMRIHNFITRSINEHNIGVDKFKDLEIYSTYVILNSRKTTENSSNLDKIENIIIYHKEFVLFITNLLMMRDNLLNCLIKSDPVNSKKIILRLEDLGILKTKFERDLLNSLDTISNQLSQLNKNIISITETLTDHLQSIENKLETQSDQLSEISGQLTYNNLISTINTYQVWKINRNTKLSLDEN